MARPSSWCGQLCGSKELGPLLTWCLSLPASLPSPAQGKKMLLSGSLGRMLSVPRPCPLGTHIALAAGGILQQTPVALQLFRVLSLSSRAGQGSRALELTSLGAASSHR